MDSGRVVGKPDVSQSDQVPESIIERSFG